MLPSHPVVPLPTPTKLLFEFSNKVFLIFSLIVVLAPDSKVFTEFYSPPVDCGSPVTPQNGTVANHTSTTNGSVIFYSCGPGLVPVGRMRAVCTRNGWDPNPADLNCTEGNAR